MTYSASWTIVVRWVCVECASSCHSSILRDTLATSRSRSESLLLLAGHDVDCDSFEPREFVLASIGRIRSAQTTRRRLSSRQTPCTPCSPSRNQGLEKPSIQDPYRWKSDLHILSIYSFIRRIPHIHGLSHPYIYIQVVPGNKGGENLASALALWAFFSTAV
jgi:hypothetical protein